MYYKEGKAFIAIHLGNPALSPTVIRWCETKKELQLLRSEVKESNDKTAAQNKLLEEIATNAKVTAVFPWGKPEEALYCNVLTVFRRPR